jgi:hypothetical protein
MPIARLALVLAVAGCGSDTPPDTTPPDPSAAAKFRGYAAVQDDLYAKFADPGSSFELSAYLGPTGDELSKLVGRPDGFGVSYDVRNAQPNAMNVLVWRMMLVPFAHDLAATCPGTHLTPLADPPLELNSQAQAIASALCAWPKADEAAIGAAWNLVVGDVATPASRAAFVKFAHDPDLQGRTADDALPNVWLGALLHPSFLLEQ